MPTAKLLLLALIATALLAGCVAQPKSTMTPLEIQSLQVREYEEPKEVVFNSVVSVFQDIGYTILSADMQTGFISTESATEDETSFIAFVLGGWAKTAQTRATGFVERIGDKTRVRLSFVEVTQRSSAYGQDRRKDVPILDAKIYENAFDKVENAIFIRSAS